jgi:hypothetical protein
VCGEKTDESGVQCARRGAALRPATAGCGRSVHEIERTLMWLSTHLRSEPRQEPSALEPQAPRARGSARKIRRYGPSAPRRVPPVHLTTPHPGRLPACRPACSLAAAGAASSQLVPRVDGGTRGGAGEVGLEPQRLLRLALLLKQLLDGRLCQQLLCRALLQGVVLRGGWKRGECE